MQLILNNNITVIVPLEDIDIVKNKEYLDELIRINIGNQSLTHAKIFLKFLTYAEPGSQDYLQEYKEKYDLGDVEVLYTQDKTIQKLDFAARTVTTPFYCFKTLSLGEVDGKKIPSILEYLPYHFEHSLPLMYNEKSQYLISYFEIVDIETFGSEEPTLFELIDETNFKFEFIKLDHLIFSKNLKFSFKECIIQHNGMLHFAPGALVAKWAENKTIKGSTTEMVTIREYVSPDQIRENLRLIIDGNTIKAIPIQQ